MDLDRLRMLYGGPPSGFVAARDALVKELRAAGERDDAAAVKRLRRHTPAQWVLNRAALTQPAPVTAFADAAGDLRAAQAAAIEGRAGGDVRAATARLRDRTNDVVAVAREIDASVAASDVRALLMDAAGDDQASRQLVDGVLGSTALGEHDPFAGLTPGEPPAARPRRDERSESTRGTTGERRARRPADDARRGPNGQRQQAREDAQRAKEQAARRREDRRRAEQAARAAAARVDDARAAVDEAERRLADARAELAEARAERDAARAALDELAE